MDSNDRNRRFGLRSFLSGLAGTAIGLALFGVLGSAGLFNRFFTGNSRLNSPPLSPNQPIQYDTVALDDTTGVPRAAENIMPSVVGITVTRTQEGRRTQGVGSGVIVDNTGYILTNNHVAGGAQSMTISLYDGKHVQGTNVWADPTHDLAIVKINTDNLQPAVLGDSDTLKVGQQAIAIGNPLGLTFQRTVTAGIVSAVNRTIEVQESVFMDDLIQTDASINPGNSGGPLTNIRGEVVGINTIKVSTAEGMGFAVPINFIKPVLQNLRNGRGFATPSLAVKALDKGYAGINSLMIDQGVLVYDCTDGGCAGKAGIKKGDIILSVDGLDVNTVMDLREYIYGVGAGNYVNLKIKDGKNNIKNVRLKLDGAM